MGCRADVAISRQTSVKPPGSEADRIDLSIGDDFSGLDTRCDDLTWPRPRLQMSNRLHVSPSRRAKQRPDPLRCLGSSTR